MKDLLVHDVFMAARPCYRKGHRGRAGPWGSGVR